MNTETALKAQHGKETAKRLTMLFAFTYISHGIATQFGLIAQPLQYFMMKGLHLTAAQVSSYLAIMMLPWVLKPFYGLVCDFVPLLGYRRKSYIIAANAMTGIAFLVMATATSLSVILGAFVVSAVGMAASTAVTTGLAVEGGRGSTKSRDFFALQTFCYYAALITASLGGGLLCHYLPPEQALRIAACIAIVPVASVCLLTAMLYHEEKAALNVQGLRDTFASIKVVLKTRALWLVALFIWFWDFSPSFGVPLYFYESNTLHFSQGLIGQLAAWNSGGMVIGALLYRMLLKGRSTRVQLWVSVVLGTLSTLAYLWLSAQSAIPLEMFRGFSNIIAILTIYALAADVCPPRAEVTVMASLIAVKNLATEASTYLGGQLFSEVFHNQLAPLVIVAAVVTGLCAFLVPFLPAGPASGIEST